MAKTKTPTEHLVVIVHKKGEVPPKLYDCPIGERTKEDAILQSQKIYEKTYGTKDYQWHYFAH